MEVASTFSSPSVDLNILNHTLKNDQFISYKYKHKKAKENVLKLQYVYACSPFKSDALAQVSTTIHDQVFQLYPVFQLRHKSPSSTTTQLYITYIFGMLILGGLTDLH
jgi:hypothetical protein